MTNFLDRLTNAEANVLTLVEAGHSNQKIAESMSITVGTVKSHLHRTYEKLDARNRLDAITKARARGYLLVSVEALTA
jgi:ATP/maltotriose-dependent transcriptional regulator MalT